MWSAWALAIGVSVPFYAVFGSLDHFLWHLTYGAGAGILLYAGGRHLRCRQTNATSTDPPTPTAYAASALAGYGYMVVPDLLFVAPRLVGRPDYGHEPWMDVFLFHYSLDLWPGTWFLLLPFITGVAVVLRLGVRRTTSPS